MNVKTRKGSRVRSGTHMKAPINRVKTHYPWDQWFDQKKILLERGKDFKISACAMARKVKDKAKKRHLVASVSASKDWVMIERI